MDSTILRRPHGRNKSRPGRFLATSLPLIVPEFDADAGDRWIEREAEGARRAESRLTRLALIVRALQEPTGPGVQEGHKRRHRDLIAEIRRLLGCGRGDQ